MSNKISQITNWHLLLLLYVSRTSVKTSKNNLKINVRITLSKPKTSRELRERESGLIVHLDLQF
jgi:hypothetical protein